MATNSDNDRDNVNHSEEVAEETEEIGGGADFDFDFNTFSSQYASVESRREWVRYVPKSARSRDNRLNDGDVVQIPTWGPNSFMCCKLPTHDASGLPWEKNFVECQVCKRLMSRPKNSNGNLRSHINTQCKVADNNTSTVEHRTVEQKKNMNSGGSLVKAFGPARQKQNQQSIALFFINARHKLPADFVEDNAFRTLCTDLAGQGLCPPMSVKALYGQVGF